MALNFEYSLTNSENLNKVIFFDGLEFPVIITPTIHGEPLLTAQAFYYLGQLESVVRIRFATPELIPQHSSRQELERIFEYIIDNYLFEYSKKYPQEQITSKITTYKYWENDTHLYSGYDRNYTRALTLDILNDDSIIDLSNKDFPNKDYWTDWCLISNYTKEYTEKYVESIQSILGKQVKIITEDHEELGTGDFELPLLEIEPGLLSYYQANMLDVLEPSRLNEKDGSVIVSRGFKSSDNFSLPLEKFTVNKHYDSNLLSYYFAAVREHLPISKFRCFYNVLEYFFEEAPKLLNENAKNEREQISCVVRLVTSPPSLLGFIKSQGSVFEQKIQSPLRTSSGVDIAALLINSPDLEANTAEWLYSIRCSIVHSKKTRKGNTEARFVPYSDDESLAQIAVPIIQNLAILCIEMLG